jgi:RsiW-degrading membrane proteinase PrsW (M82 family)
VNRLWIPVLLCAVYFIPRSHAGPFLEPSSLWPIGFALISVAFFTPFAWWLFRLDPDTRMMSLSRLGFGSLGGILAVYFLYGIGPGLAAKLFGAPVGVGIGVIQVASYVRGSDTLPLWMTILAYTVSVGLVEEGSKAFAARPECFHPVQVRAAMGFMAGIGFGLSESLTYSYRMYAGSADWTIYVVRFVLCVGSHGVMSAIAVLSLPEDWWDFDRIWVSVLRLLPIAFLHGTYDALLVRHHDGWAIAVDIATFAALPIILWWQQEQQGEV